MIDQRSVLNISAFWWCS